MLTNIMPAINRGQLVHRLDQSIRFLLYILLFWLPYSSAIIEICVIAGCLLWIVKRASKISRSEYASLKVMGRCKYFLRAFTPVPTALNIPIMIFICVCLLSIAGSAFFYIALRGFFTKVLEWFAIFFLVAETFTERRHLKIAVIILLVTSASTFIDGLLQFYFLKKDIFCGRMIARGGATAAFKHPNSLAAFCLCVIPLFYFYPKALKRKGRLRNFVMLLAGTGLWCLAITTSRAAWFSFCLGVGIFLFSRFRKWRKYFLVAVLLVFILSSIILLIENANPRLNLDQFSGSVIWRRDLWADTLVMIKDRPFFGHGINTFMMLFQEYRRKFNVNFCFGPTYAHNCYLQMAAEIGLFGLLSFLAILVALFRQRIPPQKSDISGIAQGLWWGLSMFLVHSFFDVNFYSLQLSGFFWYILSLLLLSFNLLNKETIYDKNIN